MRNLLRIVLLIGGLACVIPARSSFLPDSSTVGDEAAMLIDGYRDGYYPSRLHANRYTYADKQAMRAWWRAASRT